MNIIGTECCSAAQRAWHSVYSVGSRRAYVQVPYFFVKLNISTLRTKKAQLRPLRTLAQLAVRGRKKAQLAAPGRKKAHLALFSYEKKHNSRRADEEKHNSIALLLDLFKCYNE